MMELFINPATFSQLTLLEKLAGAGITALMGMGTTFLILLILWGCISLINKIISPQSAKSKGTELAPTQKSEPDNKILVDEQVKESQDLIAVISAAIAAYEGDQVASNLVVKKIKRVSGSSPAWAQAGLRESIDSRNF